MAGNRDFEIILKMRAEFAQAQAELKKTQGEIGKIGDQLVKANTIGSRTRSVLVGVGVAAAAMSVAAVAGLKAYIDNTIEAEKAQAQLASRIQDTAGAAGRSLAELNVQSKKLEGLTVFDDESIGNAQAMLLTFKEIKGIEFDKATAAALDLATVTGQDLPDAARQLGKALNDPIGGLAGLSKAGVQFSEDEKKVIKAMVDSGNTAGAQELILKSLESRMGTAAEAARNTLGGAMAALKNSFDDLLEGDTSNGGLKGTRTAIEQLITTINDPRIKTGVDSTASGLLSIANAAVEVIAKLGNAGSAIAEFFADNDKKSVISLQNKRTELETSLFVMERNKNSTFRRISAAIDSPFMGSLDENIAKAKAEIAEIDQLLAARQRAASQPGAAPAATGAPGTPPPVPKPTGGSTGKVVDPDEAGKRRLDSLREELGLLKALKDGETQATDAEKLRYDITEGALKNISPQLKQQLLDAQAAIDAKHADVDAEEARKKAFEETKQAYDDLREGLRTPAEVALDEAIAKVNTLNAALKDGLATTGDYHADLARIAGGLVDNQPGFQGLAPEVGGAFGELGKLDQATATEEQWYTESLARLRAFRDAQGGISVAADVQEEQLEAQHQARMQQIESARQQATLQIASGFFGQLAQLQHSQNSKMAAVGKAAAIAQALINTYQSATEAYKAMAGIPYVGPALGVAAAAAAIAAGLANVAQIRSQPTGYAEGGYTGAGRKYQPAGIVHAGEGVLNQGEIAALGGPSGFYALRDAIDDGSMRSMLYGWAGYADGGLVTPMAPQLSSPDFASFPQGGAGLAGATVSNAMRVYLSMDQDTLIEQLANHPKFEKKVVAIASENGKAITASW